jgi:hypothetical protein
VVVRKTVGPNFLYATRTWSKITTEKSEHWVLIIITITFILPKPYFALRQQIFSKPFVVKISFVMRVHPAQCIDGLNCIDSSV